MHHGNRIEPLKRRTLLAALGTSLATATLPAFPQVADWKPAKSIRLINGFAAGGSGDLVCRILAEGLRPILGQNVVVETRAGANGFIAAEAVSHAAPDGLTLGFATMSMLAVAPQLPGVKLSFNPQTELTPIANLFGEYIGVAVKADSPIKSGRDLIERMKKDPAAVSFGIATSIGNTNHQGVAGALKSAGVDIRKARNVVFQSGALAIVAMLGGHIDAVPVSVGSWVPHMKTGAVRVIAVSSAERLPGFFAGIPTWREQGANAVVSNWRGVFGPKGMSAAQVAYWENTFQRLVETPEWKAEMVTLNGLSEFMGAARLKKYMDEDYAEIKAFLLALELAKK